MSVRDSGLDVSNLGDLDRLFAQIKREKGKLDIVFANAGMAKYAALGKIIEELYDLTFDINVKGLLSRCSAAADAGRRFDYPECFNRRQQRLVVE